MHYSTIMYTDMINGEGIRVSIFVSGCEHKCKGCFNEKTWDAQFGEEFTEEIEDKIIDYFTKYNNSLRGLSFLGGDPTYRDNIQPLIKFIKKFKSKFPNKDIWIWSGYKWEMILRTPSVLELIKLCDVIIDGRFVLEQKDLNLKWRGSSNQRVINIKKSLESNSIILHCE